MRQISRDIENIERGNSSTNCLPALLGILSTCNKVFLLQVSDKGGGGSWASAVPIYKYKSARLWLKAAGENLVETNVQWREQNACQASLCIK